MCVWRIIMPVTRKNKKTKLSLLSADIRMRNLATWSEAAGDGRSADVERCVCFVCLSDLVRHLDRAQARCEHGVQLGPYHCS